MSWKKILKREINFDRLADEVEEFRLDENSVVHWNDWRAFYNKIGSSPMYPDDAGELRDLLDDNDKSYIDKHIDSVLTAASAYNEAISQLSTSIAQLEPEEEDEPEDDDIGYTTSGGRGRVHPDFKGHKLKDDEMWAEDSDGLLYPVPHRDDVSF